MTPLHDHGHSNAHNHTDQGSDKKPVALYNDPHPMNERLFESLNAYMIEASHGSVFDRLKSAFWSHYSTPVILEGGVPLVEGAFTNLLGRAEGPVILLAADETQQNIFDPLPYYSKQERLAHKWAHSHIDGAVAINDQIGEWCENLIDGPVEVATTFVLDERRKRLSKLNVNLDGNRVLIVGEYREGNGQDLLLDVARGLQYTDVEYHFVGSGTRRIGDGMSNVIGHGYVTEDELIGQFAHADLFTFTPIANANPVAIKEAMAAGVPVLATGTTGAVDKLGDIDSRFIRERTAADVAEGIEWYFDLPVSRRNHYGNQVQEMSKAYTEEKGVKQFKEAYSKVVNGT